MDAIHAAIARFKAKFATAGSTADPSTSSSADSRRMLILAVPAILVVVVVIGFLQSGYTDMVALTIAPNTDRAGVESRLTTAGLNEFQTRNGKIFVPANQVQQYQDAIPASAEIPESDWERQFAKANIFTSPEQLQEAKDIALEKTIRRSLLAVPAIKEASVTWARSRRRRWATRETVTATICLLPEPGAEITPDLAQSLKVAVANMVADLDAEHVTVLDQSTGHAVDDATEISANDQDSTTTELQVQERLTHALQFLSNPRVSVSVIDRMGRGTDSTVGDAHISLFIPQAVYRSLAKSKSTQQEIKSIVERTIGAEFNLASLHVSRLPDEAISTTSSSSGEKAHDAAAAWLVPSLIVFFSLVLLAGARMFGAGWLLNPSSQAVTERDPERLRVESGSPTDENPIINAAEPVIEPAATAEPNAPISEFTARQTVEQTVDERLTDEQLAVLNLDQTLRTHPHESLAVLQKWTATSAVAAAAVAGSLPRSLAAQIAEQMTEDEKSQLHLALQQPVEGNVSPAIEAFCSQVAAAADQSVTSKAAPLNENNRSSQSDAAQPGRRPPRKPASQPRSRLFRIPPRIVAQMIESEQPQTIAIAIAAMDEKSIEKVLRNYPLAKSNRIREQLSTVDRVSPTVRDSIQRAIVKRIESSAEELG